MLNCPTSLTYSATHSHKRFEKASKIFGVTILKRIIGFALFLLGANRREIADFLNIPYGTFLSFLTRMEKFGLPAFDDRRKNDPVEIRPSPAWLEISLGNQEKSLCIQFDRSHTPLVIPETNALQTKLLLLTFVHNQLLSAEDVSRILGCSPRHVRELSHRIDERDVQALLDHRKGQLSDYRFTPAIKAELIQQFAANAITGNPVSSRALSDSLQQRCHLLLSDRSIRHHVNKLGLSTIRNSLPALVEDLKKTTDDFPPT